MQSKEERAATYKAWYERNKEKVAITQKAYREANREKRKSWRKVWDEANKEKIASYRKTYHEAHREKAHACCKVYREANIEKISAWNKAYKQTEAGKEGQRRSERKRRAWKLKVDENFSKQDERDVLNKFNHQCFRCGMTAEDHKAKWNESIHLDHLYPLSEGNALTQNNAIILCRSCNCSKGTKNPSEFFTIKQLHELRKKGLF